MRRGLVAGLAPLVALGACNFLTGVDDYRLCDANECGDASSADVATEATTDAADADAYTGPLSCEGLAKNCGPKATDDCCASAIVQGGSFSLGLVDYATREAGPPTAATISTFRLDNYLVTIGRFRNFITATENGWHPKLGDGKHVHLDGGGLVGEPGWHSSFGAMPNTQAAWDSNGLKSGCEFVGEPYIDYTPVDIGIDNSAINCVRWQLAYAFCIWDGGFLPTYAELDYAAAGGSEQRVYPWSSPPTSTAIDWKTADYSEPQYSCTGDPFDDGGPHKCSTGDLVRVGLKTGAGRWGQLDLAGYFDEQTLDCEDPPDGAPCNDCVHNVVCGFPLRRPTHGGNFGDDQDSIHTDLQRVELVDDQGHPWMGFRCARSP